MVEMSNSYSYELLKAFNELLACDLTESMWIILKRMRELVLMQQAIQRLLLKTTVPPFLSHFTWVNTAERGVKRHVSNISVQTSMHTSVVSTENIEPSQAESYLSGSVEEDLAATTTGCLLEGNIKVDGYNEDDLHTETSDAIDFEATVANASDTFSTEPEPKPLTEVHSTPRKTKTKTRENKLKNSELQLGSNSEENKDKISTIRLAKTNGNHDPISDKGVKQGQPSTRKRKRKSAKNADPHLIFGSCRFYRQDLTLEESVDHIRLCHTEMTHEYYNCPICAKMTMSLNYHVRKYHYPNRVECDICSEPFFTEKIMQSHRKLTHFPDDTVFCVQWERWVWQTI